MATATRRGPWNHNIHFHDWVLDQMTAPCESALDVGCGDGLLTQKLARRATRTVGVDVSEKMVAVASANAPSANVSFVCGDFLTCRLPSAGFDFICAVAVLHHMPLEAALRRCADLLRRQGVLAVVGLARNRSVIDYAVSAATLPFNRAMDLARGCSPSAAPVRDPELSLGEIRASARQLLPAVEVRRRFYYRYTMLWQKP